VDEDGALFDSAFDDDGPFRVTPEAGGVSLESALRDFGPAAIDDLIPRLRAIAAMLDAAHASGAVHGAVDPGKVIVYDETTGLITGRASHHPYVAPEVAEGAPATAASDQYALAAVAYEWLFGRPIDHAAHRPIEVRSLPGVDRAALAKAFTRALAPGPADRFASCAQFCDAIAAATAPAMPLLALEAEDEDDDPVGPFVAESSNTSFDSNLDPSFDSEIAREPFDSDLVRENAAEIVAQDAPFDSHLVREDAEPALAQGADRMFAHVAAQSYQPSREPQRFGALALIVATIVGAIVGFAGGYMARPRALQSAPPETFATQPKAGEAGRAGEAGKAGGAGKVETAPVPAAPPAQPAPPARPAPSGRLLVHSTPSGAVVSVDGVAKGSTPLALRDLEMGTRTITVARRGYLPETRKVVITSARPARTLDVRLAAEATAPVRPSTPATVGRPAATVGTLTVDSRPSGASVTINGKASGTTPVTINDLAPGEYRVLMTMAGYRNVAITVRVVAGEHARAAASLTALEQQ
jgi:hypothetical protein